MSKRKATVCEACSFPSYNGRVCRDCLSFWGGPVENVLAAVALQRRLEAMPTGPWVDPASVTEEWYQEELFEEPADKPAAPIAEADELAEESEPKQGELFE